MGDNSLVFESPVFRWYTDRMPTFETAVRLSADEIFELRDAINKGKTPTTFSALDDKLYEAQLRVDAARNNNDLIIEC